MSWLCILTNLTVSQVYSGVSKLELTANAFVWVTSRVLYQNHVLNIVFGLSTSHVVHIPTSKAVSFVKELNICGSFTVFDQCLERSPHKCTQRLSWLFIIGILFKISRLIWKKICCSDARSSSHPALVPTVRGTTGNKAQNNLVHLSEFGIFWRAGPATGGLLIRVTSSAFDRFSHVFLLSLTAIQLLQRYDGATRTCCNDDVSHRRRPVTTRHRRRLSLSAYHKWVMAKRQFVTLYFIK